MNTVLEEQFTQGGAPMLPKRLTFAALWRLRACNNVSELTRRRCVWTESCLADVG